VQASFGVLRDFYPLLAGRCAPRNWNLTMSGGVRGVGEQEGSWLVRAAWLRRSPLPKHLS